MIIVILLACEPDPCEAAVERQKVVLETCGIEFQPPDYGECTSETRQILRCDATCLEQATCEALLSGPPDGGWQRHMKCMDFYCP